MSRGRAVWKLVGLITRRSQVQILLPQFELSITSAKFRDVIRVLNRIFLFNAQIAQLVEQRTENPRVAGSIPALGIFFVFRVFFGDYERTFDIHGRGI